MRAAWRRSDRGWILAALLIGGPACALAGTAEPAFPVEPAQLARAEALRALPCLGGSVDRASPSESFTIEPGLEAVWHVAGTIVAVRRAGADRFAFVLEPPQAGTDACRVQQVLVLPRRGMIMQCALPDASSKGIGVHVQSTSGRRDTAYWAVEPSGMLHRSPADTVDSEVVTDDLICSLPE